MSYKRFDWYTWLVGIGSFLILGGFLILSEWLSFDLIGGLLINSYFECDGVSFYLSVLSCVLGIMFLFFLNPLNSLEIVLVGLSILFSILSYSCIHAFYFWVFYECSILSLLVLLIVNSPYSERYVASWYLIGYVVVTSLPMLVCIFYLSLDNGSFVFVEWVKDSGYVGIYVLLSLLFITKIPLVPFHVWLPIVHAEASSVVSMCLSGYVMKLGILGVFRLCSFVLPTTIFSMSYCLVVLSFSLLSFLGASRELDGKRWLALLSLSHIGIPVICLSVVGYDVVWVTFLYCLGHGLSAGASFIFLWLMYDVSGSRSWFLIKNYVSSSLFVSLVSVTCLGTVACVPVTIQMFSEVLVLYNASFYSVVFIFMICLYLFISSLIPLFLLGGLLTRHYSFIFGPGHLCAGLYSMVVVMVCSYGFFSVM